MLYLTTVHELRSDVDRYMFSIDRCFTNLDQANERLDLLARCNAVTSPGEVICTSPAAQEGGKWLSIAARGARKARLLIEVKCTWVSGTINEDDDLDHSNRLSLATARLLGGATHDLANHVFVVATNQPDNIPTITLAGRPQHMSWAIESVYPIVVNALTRARQLWALGMVFDYGPAERHSHHYGLSRFVLMPHFPYTAEDGRLKILHQTGVQIRIERIRITKLDEVESYVPASAILYKKSWYPLCSGREYSAMERYLEELDDQKDLVKYGHSIPRKERQKWADTQRAPPPTKRAFRGFVPSANASRVPSTVDSAYSRSLIMENRPPVRNLVDAYSKLLGPSKRYREGSVQTIEAVDCKMSLRGQEPVNIRLARLHA